MNFGQSLLFRPISLIGLALMVLAGITGIASLVVLAFLLWVLLIGALFLIESQRRAGPHPADISPQDRTLLRPILGLRDELAVLLKQNSDMPTVKVVGQEALAEADRIVRQATNLVQLRTTLRKTMVGRSEARVSIASLQSKREAASTDGERTAIDSALAAQQAEAENYDKIETSLRQIDGKLLEAQAGLSELKARLAIGAAGARSQTAEPEGLTETVGRLRALSKSFSEAENALGEQVQQ